jgi:PAS domain S-box-containing protein
MKDERKTKRQLVAELEGMRRQVAELRGRLRLLEGEDVAGRMWAEQALQESEKRYRVLVESAAEGVLVIQDDVVRFANPRCMEILGRSESDVVGRPGIEFVHPEDRQKLGEIYARRMVGGPALGEYEYRILDEAGRIRWLRANAAATEWAGRPAALVLVTDVTDRMQAEEALKESEMKLRLVFENAFDGISIYEELTDRGEHRLLDCNERYAEMAGRSKEELLEIGNTTLVQKKVSPARSKQENLRLRREKRSYQGIFSWIRPDGQENIIEYSASPVQVGERALSIGVDRDITERVRAEEAMRQASRLEATATLAGGIAHDLNNLMVGVLGYADMLKADLADREDPLEMLEVVSESARRAARLAQQLLAYARGGKYQPRTMNLNEIIQQVASAQERAVPSRIRIVLDADPELWDAEADPAQMSEVALNLLTNAVEAIEGSGRITVATSNRVLDEGDVPNLEPGRYVCLSVQDTGCGMSEQVQARMFEPFFTTKFQGRGLGLAAVYGIVENHGGHITVQSEEGRGSTLQVYLPAIYVADVESPGAATAVEAGRDVTLVALATVLVVEGDESVLNLTQRMLERMDCQTLPARSGQEAIDVARAFDGEIHLALLDMETSGVGGTEIYPLLVEARPGTRVILCSGYGLDARAHALLDAGASAFIQKPFQMSAFEAEIRKALKG